MMKLAVIGPNELLSLLAKQSRWEIELPPSVTKPTAGSDTYFLCVRQALLSYTPAQTLRALQNESRDG